MIQQTVEEQRLRLRWHANRQRRLAPRHLLRESDEIMFWLEECLVQRIKVVPGWLHARLTQLLSQADPALNGELGRERRPEQVMELLYRAQEALMEQSILSRQPAKVIPLFRS